MPLDKADHSLKRIYDDVARFMDPGYFVQITWDASPWGMGAFLAIGGAVRGHFAVPISKDDEVIPGAKSGVSDFQQIGNEIVSCAVFDVENTVETIGNHCA